MITIDALATFLGWCSIINTGVLLFSTVILIMFKDFISAIHSKMFGVSPSNLPSAYFQYLGNYKIAIFILNIVPYFALKIMA